jgi:peptidylprolyl isomerase
MRFRTCLAVAVAMAATSLVACGSAATSSSSSPAAPTSTTLAFTKPKVKLPSAAPTSLVVTDLTEGTGAAAANGDTVVVHYVGVRSADGKEFDNSYDKGTPIPVTLGVGQVIKGWDQGLVGVKKGGRRQLDIPADLAYGNNPKGGVIQPGDALSFVIDVVTIIPKPDPANAPKVSIPPTANIEKATSKELIVGTGPALQNGQFAVIHFLAFSAKDGKQIDSTWESGAPLSFIPGKHQLPPGLEKAVEGMRVGGRRQVQIPFADAFGESGNAGIGLPASTDLIMVIDLVAAY